ncbi:Hydantoin racemase [Archaeoglobus sulfaticallidus PM70-1]|uniref:Hydantoin racemase n=1 Tax=Archaeoglobus sulfaticallidus PM70-1 TaxID=387631 RepID=N0BNW1_9EURY|nr:aspartate/glutamate racemase family protein [Archaeoglobus sulfaticallidus]AGK62010.1 Hydantoin racemase [Archaeoglobus sulfaticallidus PM70-1]
MRIRVIVPIIVDIFDEEVKKEFGSHSSSEVEEIEVVHLDKGTASIESEFDEALAAPDILNKVIEAEKKGFDGVIIDCFGDPAVKAAREVVDIPVVGAAEPSMLLACSLGQRFSVVTVLENVIPMIENIAKVLGVYEKLASVRSVNIPVLELHDKDTLKNALFEEMLKAIKEDKAHVLILGCTGMMGVADDLHEMLAKEGYDVPVIDPAAASIRFLEVLIGLGLKQSRLTYMKPPEKERKL